LSDESDGSDGSDGSDERGVMVTLRLCVFARGQLRNYELRRTITNYDFGDESDEVIGREDD